MKSPRPPSRPHFAQPSLPCRSSSVKNPAWSAPIPGPSGTYSNSNVSAKPLSRPLIQIRRNEPNPTIEHPSPQPQVPSHQPPTSHQPPPPHPRNLRQKPPPSRKLDL